jgi:hypothetical protein
MPYVAAARQQKKPPEPVLRQTGAHPAVRRRGGRHSTFGKRSASAPFIPILSGTFGIIRRSEKMLQRYHFPAGISAAKAEYDVLLFWRHVSAGGRRALLYGMDMIWSEMNDPDPL